MGACTILYPLLASANLQTKHCNNSPRRFPIWFMLLCNGSVHLSHHVRIKHFMSC